MKRTKLETIVTLALCACALSMAQAQEIHPMTPAGYSFEEGLTAHGHAEMKFKPDIAYVEIGVVTQARDSAQAVQENATRATALLKALQGAGTADKDIQTQFYGVQPQYDYNTSPAVLTGYQVTNTVQVTVRDLKKVGQVIDKAAQAGGNQVNGVTFDLADRTQAEGQALARAVTEARAKANVMAQAAGISLGRLLNLSEGSAPSVEPVMLERPMMMRATAAEPSTPVSPQEITVTADVTVVYGMGL